MFPKRNLAIFTTNVPFGHDKGSLDRRLFQSLGMRCVILDLQ